MHLHLDAVGPGHWTRLHNAIGSVAPAENNEGVNGQRIPNQAGRFMATFKLESPFQPAGDQPQAVERLVEGLRNGRTNQTLMGVTGSGKTFTMANVIARYGRPTLVMSHNKTLAAQLYAEFKEFFPKNAVRYFVSYYDYYQPEAYIPQRDIYIEKDAAINEEIERLRLACTSALVSREDVLVVASVSCIYGLGSPEDYRKMMVRLQLGDQIDRDVMLLKFVDIQYERNDVTFERGKFRVRGDVVELWPAYEEFGYRIELFGDEVERLATIDPLTGKSLETHQELFVYPAKHFVMPEERIKGAVDGIAAELEERLQELKEQGKLLEAQRLGARTRYDMEMLMEVGYCSGIENYSRHLSGRKPGEAPNTLLDFFPRDSLLILDESHVTVPQIRGMFAGDFSRKSTLVEHGFRLPSAIDNRPLRFDEWEAKFERRMFVSATPGDYEVAMTGGEIVEQVIRPTGLIDPIVRVEPARGQVPALLQEVKLRAARGERVLITTLTKRLAEDLSGYLKEQGLRCKWLHSELDAFERVTILRELREGAFDALVGVNLLREGLDLPEVSMVCILDADKEGFLRSETSLIQTIGRSARHVNAEVVLYADKVTASMQRAIDETQRRRTLQMEYNAREGITPETIVKAIRRGIEEEVQARTIARRAVGRDEVTDTTAEYLSALEAEMLEAAEKLEFERAAALRDKILEVRSAQGDGPRRPAPSPQARSARARAKGKPRGTRRRR
jgi:excinuclease ABC subunit B